MIYEIGNFEFDTDLVELRTGDRIIPIEPKPFALLDLLIQNKDRVLSRDEIFDQVWGGVFVSDATLSSGIAQIRRALGDDGKAQLFIKTVHGRGFRFVAEVTPRSPTNAKPQFAKIAEPDIPRHTPTEGGQPVIAVLPFDLLGTVDAHGAIAEALPSELIATLTQLKWVKTIARASSFQFRGADADVKKVRDKLGATYILSGSIELHNNKLRIVAELVDARSQQLVWSESFNGTIDDIFELRTQIVRSIAVVAEYRLAQNESELLSRIPSENLDAWGHYHRGVRAMFHYRKSDNEIARGHFEKAASIDPEFARAHAALSYSEFQNYFQQFGSEFDQHRQLALSHAENAVRYDPFDPYCNLMMGRSKWIEGDVEEGLTWVDRSLNLAPNYSFAFYNSGLLNTIMCDGEQAETHVASALSRSPVDPHIQTMLGTRALAAFVRRDEEVALRYADQAMLAQNAHPHVYLIAAGIQGTYGDVAKAQRSLGVMRRWKVNFETSGLSRHFDLRDEERKNTLFGTLERLNA